jgi:hypothetical protein
MALSLRFPNKSLFPVAGNAAPFVQMAVNNGVKNTAPNLANSGWFGARNAYSMLGNR